MSSLHLAHRGSCIFLSPIYDIYCRCIYYQPRCSLQEECRSQLGRDANTAVSFVLHLAAHPTFLQNLFSDMNHYSRILVKTNKHYADFYYLLLTTRPLVRQSSQIVSKIRDRGFLDLERLATFHFLVNQMRESMNDSSSLYTLL